MTTFEFDEKNAPGARVHARLSAAISLSWREGTILIEGIVQRVDGHIGPAALQHLVELIDRDGPSAIAGIEGDFVALVRSRAGIHAFKSFTSQFQIYYREADRLVANRLVAFWDAATGEWNEDYFARHVLIVPGYQFLSRETPIKGVMRVLPGELVSIGRHIERQQLVRRSYAYKIDSGQRREDAAEQVLHLLRDAIKTRLAARPKAGICVEISGGLDSSFIACLLGEQLSSGIRGVMFSQPRLPSHAISEQYARDVAERYGIDLTVLPPEALPKGTPDAAAGYCDEPSDFFWFGDIFSRAVAELAEPHSYVFTGFGADQLFLRSPAFLPYLLKQKKYDAFRQALPEASHLLARGQISLAWQCLVCQLPAELHRRLQAAWFSRSWNPWDVSDVNMERTLTGDIPWLRCGRSFAEYSLERQNNEADLVGDGILCDDWGYFSAPRAVTQAHFAGKSLVDASPFCDLPLLDYVYDHVSALLVHDFGGRYKEILREAQKGIVPESLRGRQNDTFVFNSFQMNYLDASRERFDTLLEEADEAWIDIKSARRAFQQLSFGVASSSTRSVTALLGYLQWKQSFCTHASQDRIDVGLFKDRVLERSS